MSSCAPPSPSGLNTRVYPVSPRNAAYQKEEEERDWCNLKTSYPPEESAVENKIIAA